MERTAAARTGGLERVTGHPRASRAALLLLITALSALSYAWAISQDPLETYYGAAVRSMAMSWHNFFFGAVDPAGTITLDKLPGAFWLQALSVRIFGFHPWAIVAPQVVEGVLTVLVLYRAVARLATPTAGLIAALVLAASPATVALDRGNISDTLLTLLLVLAASATSHAIVTGRFRSLFLAAVWVGLAFQAKMIEAWLLLPALGLAYLLFGPARPARRVAQLVAAGIVAAAVSLAWMIAVALTPGSDRPYVDGSHHNSIFQQVFVYNGFGRFGDQTPLQILSNQSLGIDLVQTPAAAWNRLLQGDLGRDTAWLLPAALLIAIWGVVANRHRACFVLWGVWLVTLTVVFSLTATLNAYYTAALSPAIGAIIGAGLAALWADSRVDAGVASRAGRWRGRQLHRIGAAVIVAGTVIYAVWLVPGTGTHKPGWLVPAAIALGAVATVLLLASSAFVRDSLWTVALAGGTAAALLVPAVASAELVAHHQGAFDTPFESAADAAAITNLFVTVPAQVKTTIPRLTAGEQGAPYLMAAETSALASVFIYDSGQEALPIGGFTGTIPSPTLTQLQRDIGAGKFHLVLAANSRDRRLVWIAAHCLHLPAATATLNAYYCLTTDTPGSG